MYRRKELMCIILVQAALTLVLSCAKPIRADQAPSEPKAYTTYWSNPSVPVTRGNR